MVRQVGQRRRMMAIQIRNGSAQPPLNLTITTTAEPAHRSNQTTPHSIVSIMSSRIRGFQVTASNDQPGLSAPAVGVTVRGLMEIARVVPVPGLLDTFALLAKVVEHIQVH